MKTEQYISQLQTIAINAINALRCTGCADRRADDLSEKLEALADPPSQLDTPQDLRSKGYAVVVFTPEELDGASRRLVEDALIEEGWDIIEAAK